MGNCASSDQYTRRGGGLNGSSSSSTAKIIHHLDGKLQEFKLPTKAGQVLSKNPNCFLCCSDTMQIDSPLHHTKEDEQLQIGQIYFLMPLRKSQAPLSLPQLCALAIQASSVLGYLPKTPLRYSDTNCAICGRVPI
ncbi:hypothetical protein Q3G72_033288 [Acer saccharum]|nr:hypothetical protein Q3G72_033288 [Acer saccharum]